MSLGPGLDSEVMGGVPLQRQVSKVHMSTQLGPSDSLGSPLPGPPGSPGGMRAPLLTRQLSKIEDPKTIRDVGMHNSTVFDNLLNNRSNQGNNEPINVLMIGTGEYTTGYVNGQASDSDKGAGVVALTMLDLKLKGIN